MKNEGEQVRDHLRNLKLHKSMGRDMVHSRVLRELEDEVVIYEKSWQSSEVRLGKGGKRGNITSILKG